MSALKNVLEPGLIVIVFTIGVFANSRPLRSKRTLSRSSSPILGPLPVARDPQKPQTSWLVSIVPDNSRFRENITSRVFAALPFLIEIWYWNLTYWTYQLSRALTAAKIRNNKAVWERAKAHALSILSFEERRHIAIERPLQSYVLRRAPSLVNVLAAIYYSHIIVFVAFLVYTYTFLPRSIFQHIRRAIAACNLLAFIILSAYRVVPPRLLPKSYGFTDVLHPEEGDSGSSWTHNKYQLTIAAMPSLHFGMASFIALCLIKWAPHQWLRVVAVLWPAAMLITILATANHFILDAVVGVWVPVFAWKFGEVFLLLRPVEEWLFWLLRTEKPPVADEDPVFVKNRENTRGEERID